MPENYHDTLDRFHQAEVILHKFLSEHVYTPPEEFDFKASQVVGQVLGLMVPGTYDVDVENNRIVIHPNPQLHR